MRTSKRSTCSILERTAMGEGGEKAWKCPGCDSGRVSRGGASPDRRRGTLAVPCTPARDLGASRSAPSARLHEVVALAQLVAPGRVRKPADAVALTGGCEALAVARRKRRRLLEP